MRFLHPLKLVLISSLLMSCQSVGLNQQPSTGHQAAVASAHPLATQAGMDILAQGGNAFDAAVAVSTTLAVVEPYSSGMGGGGFWLLHRASDNHDMVIDGREVAPLRAHRDMYLDKDGNVVPDLSITGPLSAGIPGQPAALVHIAKQFGKLDLQVSLAPAIRAAQNGFAVTPHYRRMAQFRLDALRQYSSSAEIFLDNNEVPADGFIIRQPDLARTLQRIAQHGHDGFYAGPVARQLVDGTNAAGGIWSLADLNNYKVKQRRPLVGHYRGFKVTTVPPPSSGGVAILSMLNMLSAQNWHRLSLHDQQHVFIEVMRRAYRDRAEFLGDSDFVPVPVSRLISQAHANNLVTDINMNQATPSQMLQGIGNQPKGNHTTHFSIIDKDGNRVAATLSINYPFGSCFVVPGTGILLNDEMDDFSAKPGTPNAYGLVGAEANAIAPGKRMLSSMSPTFVESENMIAVLGTPGGSRIITMVMHGVLGVVENKTAQQIVSQPRFHHQYLPDKVQYEPGTFDQQQIDDLVKRGHELQLLDSSYGNMQVVIKNKHTGRLSAASDPRGEGSASVKP